MKPQRVLFVPDTHAPYHDKKAWALLIKAAKQFKPDIIICVGDFWDFYAVSSFPKDPRRVACLADEIEAGLEVHQDLDRLGAKRKVFIEGNHENRLERYLTAKAPELFNVVKIPEVLELDDRGWEYVPYKQFFRLGKLYVTHDCGYSGANALSRSQATFEDNIVIGHTHRLDYRVVGNAKGHPHVAASFGWLGDATKADYMHRIKANREWATGFGVGYLRANGTIHLQPIPIVRGRCVLEGKEISL